MNKLIQIPESERRCKNCNHSHFKNNEVVGQCACPVEVCIPKDLPNPSKKEILNLMKHLPTTIWPDSGKHCDCWVEERIMNYDEPVEE